MNGLDLSEFQANINFNHIKNKGYDFVMLRGGFTGYGTGTSLNKDSWFETFYYHAKQVGLKVGAYWYSCANTKEKGIAEAKYFYENCLKGKKFEYPVAIDVEDPYHQAKDYKGTTEAIIAFGDYLEKLGYYVVVYANYDWFNNRLYTDKLKRFDKWLAFWTKNKPATSFDYGIWQNSNSGYIDNFRVDTNKSYKDYSKIMLDKKLNGFTSEEVKPEYTESVYYTVKSGDTLYDIGLKFNVPYQTIYKNNKDIIGDDPGLIYPGQKLFIK